MFTDGEEQRRRDFLEMHLGGKEGHTTTNTSRSGSENNHTHEQDDDDDGDDDDQVHGVHHQHLHNQEEQEENSEGDIVVNVDDEDEYDEEGNQIQKNNDNDFEEDKFSNRGGDNADDGSEKRNQRSSSSLRESMSPQPNSRQVNPLLFDDGDRLYLDHHIGDLAESTPAPQAPAVQMDDVLSFEDISNRHFHQYH